MRNLFIVIPVLLTSAAACWVGLSRLRRSSRSLKTAFGKMLESIGYAVVFFVLNLAVAMGVILAARTLTPRFVSIYLADDVGLLVLSLLQGLTFHWWRESSRR